ncbi:hypothetical protein N177_2444 [Lutibaculum baratangense AMV1]|uniref:Uncharacterized protein n=1 Tax=Lutibaculum baratangense AMV1 TaxID=631454 RepID=V4TDV3_9HYPH|nr:hypothetical protein N177_2444 [Lutibaculum baratangense AMV1]
MISGSAGKGDVPLVIDGLLGFSEVYFKKIHCNEDEVDNYPLTHTL